MRVYSVTCIFGVKKKKKIQRSNIKHAVDEISIIYSDEVEARDIR